MTPPVVKGSPPQPVKKAEDAAPPPAPVATAPTPAPLVMPGVPMCMKDDPPAKPKTLPPPVLGLQGISIAAMVFRAPTPEEELDAQNRRVSRSLKEGMDAKAPDSGGAPSGIADPGVGKYLGGVPGGGDVGIGVRVDVDPGVQKITVEAGAKAPVLGSVGIKVPVFDPAKK